MRKTLIIGMMALMLVSVVSGMWISQLSENTIKELTRQQMINNLNIECENPFIQDAEVVYYCQINTIETVEQQDGTIEYWLVREGFYPKLNFEIVQYCLNNYEASMCKEYLVNNPFPLEVTIKGENYTFFPIQYQIIAYANEVLDHVTELQNNIIDQSMLQLIQNQGGVIVPVIQ